MRQYLSTKTIIRKYLIKKINNTESSEYLGLPLNKNGISNNDIIKDNE